jgi:hypothetical protein
MIRMNHTVIASVAKQSSAMDDSLDCFVALFLLDSRTGMLIMIV